MRNSNNRNVRNNSLLGFSYRMTLISTTLTAIAPLITTLVDGLCTGNLLGAAAFNAINTVMPLVNAVSVLTLICNMGGSVLAAKRSPAETRNKQTGFLRFPLHRLYWLLRLSFWRFWAT